MFGAIEESATAVERADLNQREKDNKSAFAIGMEQAELSIGEGIEDQAYDKVFSSFDDYGDNKQFYDAAKSATTESDWIFSGKGYSKARYFKSIDEDMFKLDASDNVVLGSSGFRGIELLYDMDAIKGLLLAQKHGFSETSLKTAYSEITQAKSSELSQQAEGKSLVGRVGGIIAGHLAQPQTLAEVAMSPHQIMGKTVLGGMAKAFGIESLVVIPGEISREQRTRQHMEMAGLEYGLWDSVKNVLTNAGIGGFIRGAGSGIVDANTVRQINKRLDDPTDKAIVNRFFQREAYKLTADTNKHIALVEKSLSDMNANRVVDVSQHTDIDINAKTDTEVEAISLDDELTKRDMANGYQDEVQSFENEYAKAEPIPEEPYNGDIRPDEDLDLYAGMATKEEGDELIAEMSELDPEIKAELEEIQAEMKIVEDLSPINKKSEAAKNRMEKKRLEAEKMFGADEDKIKEFLSVKKNRNKVKEKIYENLDDEAIEMMDKEYLDSLIDDMAEMPLDAEGKSVFSLGGGDPLGGALGGGFFGGTEGLYEDIVEGKDLTMEDYLARIGAGMAIGAGLGAKYGGKGGAKSFVGETEPKKSKFLERRAAKKKAGLIPDSDISKKQIIEKEPDYSFEQLAQERQAELEAIKKQYSRGKPFIPKKLYRGINDEGRGGTDEGIGLYTTTNKKFASEYGDVIEMDEVKDIPRNPLVFQSNWDFEMWVQQSFKALGYNTKREYRHISVNELVNQVDNTIDGIQVGKGNNTLFVLYPPIEELSKGK